MNKQFVTYEIALKLKELCFDEECFAIYDAYQHNRLVYLNEDGRNSAGIIKTNESMEISSLAPLWQQVIDWLRENYDIHINIVNEYELPSKSYYAELKYDREDILNKPYRYEVKLRVYPNTDRGVDEGGTYHEAREVGVLKAIELIKEKQQC